MSLQRDESQFVTAGELTGTLLISDIEIARLARRGILPRIPNPDRPNMYLYPPLDCAREYIRHLKSKGQQDRDRYRSERAKSEKQRARLLTSENDARSGRLVETDEMEAREKELALAIRARLALIPLRLADRLGENGDRLAIEAAARAEISDALLSLSEIGSEVSDFQRSDPAGG